MQICRICLITRCKMYSMKKHNLNSVFEQITGQAILPSEESLPQQLCWECAHRLFNAYRLKKKALLSQELMVNLLQATALTQKSLKHIDRNAYKLTSTLAYKTFDVDHSDLHIHETSLSVKSLEKPDILEESEKLDILELEVKNEEEINEESNINDNNDFQEETSLDSFSSSDIVLSKHKGKIKNNGLKKFDKVKKSNTKPKKVDRRRKPANQVLNEDIFNITNLTHEEQVLEVLKRQESSNYRKSDYRCLECYKGFLDEEAYKCHMIRHTDQSGSYVCEICKVRFKTQHALRNHISSHMQKFICKKCSFVTTRRHAAKLHEEYHNGTRYQCPHCLEDFGKFSTYMSHIRIKHPSDFVCELCGYSFVSGKGLGLHKKLKHRFDDHAIPEDGPNCDQCDVRFISNEALERHMKLSARHNTECKENRKRGPRNIEDIANKHDLQKKKNKANSKPEGPIPCEQCEMQLSDSISYYRHFRRAHPDKNRTNYPSMRTKCMCEVCGKMFQSLALLQDHSFTHTDSKQFICAQCGKSFQRKYRLIAHRRLHLSRRASHACAVCGKRFSTASNMQRHMVSHTGLKPFKCEMCGKCFKHASEKRVHITYVHLKKPWPKRSRGKRRSDKQNPAPTSVPSEVDTVQPLWPACSDSKIDNKPITSYNII